MPLTATNEGRGFERTLIPADNHLAICYSVIDLGTHDFEWMGKTKKLRKVKIGWETPNESFEYVDKENNHKLLKFRISKEYTLSLDDRSNLYKDLISWRGRDFTPEELAGFDLAKLLGVPCQINVIHKTSKQGRDYAVISSVSKVVKGTEIPELSCNTQYFSFEDKPIDENTLNSLPEYLQNKIRESYEWQEYVSDGNANIDTDDDTDDDINNEDIPF